MGETPLVMPKMSMTMTEGTLVTWHKSAGAAVRAGEVVCEVATDKVDMEVEAPVDGTLVRLVAQPDEVVAVGEPIAYLTTTSEDLLAGLFEAPAPPQPATPEPVPAPEPVAPVAPVAPVRIAAVPAARRAAAERGLDLATITPTGPSGTIRLTDLPPLPVRPRRSPRAVIARRMSASARIPQFVVYRDLELPADGADWTTAFVRALAGALRRHPELNAEWADDDVRRHDHVGVALAVDTDRGLLAPVLRDPDLDDELARHVREVVRRARAGRLTLAEMSGGTTTVSNLGGLGVDAFHALLSPPQATALAVGRVQEKVVPVPGGIGVALRCTVGLTIDHRVGDGADAARLLASVQELLAL